VLDWVADRSLAHLGREEIFAVQGDVAVPTVVMQGIVTNRRGQNIAVAHLAMRFMGTAPMAQTYNDPADLFDDLGLGPETVGVPVQDPQQYEQLIPQVVEATQQFVDKGLAHEARREAEDRAQGWVERMDDWEHGAEGVAAQTQLFRRSRSAVEAERRLAREMLPDRTYVRPLLVVVPAGGK
jgi:hypothetical protein